MKRSRTAAWSASALVACAHVALYDVAPDGTAVLFDEQVALLRSGETAFDLRSTDWTLPAGHSLVVEIGTRVPRVTIRTAADSVLLTGRTVRGAGGRTMTTSTSAPLSHRDRAVLHAVAAGRCALTGPTLLVDGLCCADQFLCARLTGAGLIDGSGPTGPVCLTPAGRAALDGR